MTTPSTAIRSKLPGWTGLAAPALLLLSPFLLGFTGAAVLSAFVLGAIAIGVKLKPMIRAGARDRWLVAATGAVIVIAPWLMGFADAALATWTHVLLGLAIVATANRSVPLRLPDRTGGDTPGGPAEAS